MSGECAAATRCTPSIPWGLKTALSFSADAIYPCHVCNELGSTPALFSRSFQYHIPLTSAHAQIPYTLPLYTPPSQFARYQSFSLPQLLASSVRSVSNPF